MKMFFVVSAEYIIILILTLLLPGCAVPTKMPIRTNTPAVNTVSPLEMPALSPSPTLTLVPVQPKFTIEPIPSSKVTITDKIAFSTKRDGNWEIYSMNVDGTEQINLTKNPADDLLGGWSPDGANIVFVSERTGELDIFIMNPDGSGLKNLTNNPAIDTSPAWSPDGRLIAFISDRDGHEEIYVMNADGSQQTRLTNEPNLKVEPAWSPDGQYIAFTYNDFNNYNFDVCVVNLQSREIERLTEDSYADGSPIWSPDGSFIYFNTQRQHGYSFYRMNADGSNETLVVWPSVYGQLSWSPDGVHFVTAFSPRDSRTSIYIFNSDGSEYKQITDGSFMDEEGDPAWSPNNQYIAFISNRDGDYDIYLVKPDGSGLLQLTNDDEMDTSPIWQPKPK